MWGILQFVQEYYCIYIWVWLSVVLSPVLLMTNTFPEIQFSIAHLHLMLIRSRMRGGLLTSSCTPSCLTPQQQVQINIYILHFNISCCDGSLNKFVDFGIDAPGSILGMDSSFSLRLHPDRHQDTQNPIKFSFGGSFPGIIAERCETGSPPSSSEVYDAWRSSSMPAIRLHNTVLNPMGNFIFTL